MTDIPGFDLTDFVQRTFAEDLGTGGDVTSAATIAADARFAAVMASREEIVVAGLDLAAAVFNSLDPRCQIGLYTLRADDTRALVAAKFDITEVELNSANVATDGYLEFLPGLVIIIPPRNCPAPTSTTVE